MRRCIIIVMLSIASLLCGCSSTKYTEYHSSDVFQGKGGGSVRSVDGIDFWEDGDADRNYKILGLLEVSRKHVRLPGHINSLMPGSGDLDSAIAKAARKKGGDAVIFVNADQEQPSEDQDEGGKRRHGQAKKLIVIQYVGEPKPY